MQRRSETRISEQLSIRVWGMDSRGKPFSQSATTLDFSRGGARIGLKLWNTPGEVVGVAFGEFKARFRVVWIGNQATGCVGLRCIEPARNLWGEKVSQPRAASGIPGPPRQIMTAPLPKPSLTWSDSYRTSAPMDAGDNRREHRRFECAGGVQVRQVNTKNVIWGRMIDLSAGGCYIEALAVLPKGTLTELNVAAGERQFRARGEVTIVHPAFGFGVKFLVMDALNRDNLQLLIGQLSHPQR